MSLTEPTTPDRSSQPARMVLWLAVVAFGVSQLFTANSDESRVGWYFKDLADMMRSLSHGVLTTNLNWTEAIAFVVAISFLTALIATPLLVNWLRRARPILWIMRLLALGILGILTYMLYTLLRFYHLAAQVFEEEREPYPVGIGFWLFLAAILFTTLGLWMIPKPVKHQLHIAADTPTTDEHR
jgi:hypothetical protein